MSKMDPSVVFGSRLPLAQAYHDSLATDGSTRGFIGPREVPRLWDRHIINCAVVKLHARGEARELFRGGFVLGAGAEEEEWAVQCHLLKCIGAICRYDIRYG